MNSFSVLIIDSINTSLDKSAVFPSFSEATTFLASSVTYASPNTFPLDASAAGFDTCGKKVEDE